MTHEELQKLLYGVLKRAKNVLDGVNVKPDAEIEALSKSIVSVYNKLCISEDSPILTVDMLLADVNGDLPTNDVDFPKADVSRLKTLLTNNKSKESIIKDLTEVIVAYHQRRFPKGTPNLKPRSSRLRLHYDSEAVFPKHEEQATSTQQSQSLRSLLAEYPQSVGQEYLQCLTRVAEIETQFESNNFDIERLQHASNFVFSIAINDYFNTNCSAPVMMGVNRLSYQLSEAYNEMLRSSSSSAVIAQVSTPKPVVANDGIPKNSTSASAADDSAVLYSEPVTEQDIDNHASEGQYHECTDNKKTHTLGNAAVIPTSQFDIPALVEMLGIQESNNTDQPSRSPYIKSPFSKDAEKGSVAIVGFTIGSGLLMGGLFLGGVLGTSALSVASMGIVPAIVLVLGFIGLAIYLRVHHAGKTNGASVAPQTVQGVEMEITKRPSSPSPGPSASRLVSGVVRWFSQKNDDENTHHQAAEQDDDEYDADAQSIDLKALNALHAATMRDAIEAVMFTKASSSDSVTIATKKENNNTENLATSSRKNSVLLSNFSK